MVYTVALTGGIGSGKSTVANAFAQLGVTVVDADIIARQVVNPGSSALAAIVDHFGLTVCDAHGELDRRALREKVFASADEKNWLNALLHPLIGEQTRREIARATSAYVLWVVPLLVENQLAKNADRVLVVDVTPETQLARTVLRDGVSCDLAQRMLAAQASRSARLAVADDVIDNNGLPGNLAADVARLHQHYLHLAAQATQQEFK